MKPHRESVQKFQRKLRKLSKRNWGVPLDYRILKLKQVIFGWVNYFRIANMKAVTKRIDQKLRSRIRVIIWKQWKVPRKQIKSLIQLGIPVEEAKGLTFCRRGYRYIGLSKVIQRAISTKRLKQRGLPAALEYYLKVTFQVNHMTDIIHTFNKINLTTLIASITLMNGTPLHSNVQAPMNILGPILKRFPYYNLCRKPIFFKAI